MTDNLREEEYKMKANWIYIILSFLIGCSTFSISQGAGRFYYGTYSGHEGQNFPFISDSLKFNIVYDSISIDNVQLYVNNSLRAIVSNHAEGTPAYYATYSHYTLWDPESYQESYFHLTPIGGDTVLDASAYGGKAMYFNHPPDSAGFIQTGPGYDQELGSSSNPIQYTAEFRLKSPLYFPNVMSGKSGSGPVKLCRLMVVGNGQVLGDSTVYGREFNNFNGYKSYKITYHATQNHIEFKIYWYGNRQLYVDYVKVYDYSGNRLMTGQVDQAIKDYVSQSWVHDYRLTNGDTVVYRWFLVDEPYYIDCFEPSRYIDSLLREKSTERVGFQVFNQWGSDLEHEYFIRQNPKEYSIDIYPTRWWLGETTGATYQNGIDTYVHHLNAEKQKAIEEGKDFWVTIQGHYYGKLSPDSFCVDTLDYPLWVSDSLVPGVTYPGWYCYYLKRPPTPNEVRFQTFLALCYGANSILNYCYYTYNHPVPEYGGDTILNFGLYNDLVNQPTDRWREIKNFTSPRVVKLGPLLNQLTWEGACFGDSVGDFYLRNGPHSYIDSIVGIIHPDSTYVQVGFFSPPYGDTMFFMLVNRRTLPSENDTFEVYFNFSDGPYVVIDMYNSPVPEGKISGLNRYKIFLQPGEGRLFRIEGNAKREG